MQKSLQRLGDFKQLGIDESRKGAEKLISYMDKAVDAAPQGGKINSNTGRYKVFKTVDVVEDGKSIGSIQFGFSYADESMKGTPEVMTAIPKTTAKK